MFDSRFAGDLLISVLQNIHKRKTHRRREQSILTAIEDHTQSIRRDLIEKRKQLRPPSLSASSIEALDAEDEDAVDKEIAKHGLLGQEDKFWILAYVVVRANVPNLLSELQLLRTFASPTQVSVFFFKNSLSSGNVTRFTANSSSFSLILLLG